MSNYDPTDINEQERAQAEQDKRDKLARDSEVDDFKWLMGYKRGRRIVWRQLDRAGVFRLSFNTNAMSMAFAEGNRNEGLRIIGLINRYCPDHYMNMVKENTHASRNDDD